MVSGKDMFFVSGNFKAIMPATKAVTPNTISGVAFPTSLSMYEAYNRRLDLLNTIFNSLFMHIMAVSVSYGGNYSTQWQPRVSIELTISVLPLEIQLSRWQMLRSQ